MGHPGVQLELDPDAGAMEADAVVDGFVAQDVELADVEPGAAEGPLGERTLEAVSHDGCRAYFAPEGDDGPEGYEVVARHQAAGEWVQTPGRVSLREYLTVHAAGHVLADLAEQRRPGAILRALEAADRAAQAAQLVGPVSEHVSRYADESLGEFLAELYVQAAYCGAPWAVAAVKSLRRNCRAERQQRHERPSPPERRHRLCRHGAISSRTFVRGNHGDDLRQDGPGP